MPEISSKPTYEALSALYKQFVGREQGFNAGIIGGDIKWYRDAVGIDSHFERGILDSAAKSEPLTIKRVVALNAFEHIAAMDRAQAVRELDYADYFVRRDVSLEDDNDTMGRWLNFFHKVITQKIV